MFNLTEADEYFETHLKQQFWESLTAQQKSAALKGAVRDIENHLGADGLDETDIFIYCSVFEQAVYLAEYFDELNSPVRVVGESVDGVGARKYGLTADRDMISPRARAFLERITAVSRVRRG